MKSKTKKLLIVGFIALIILAIGGIYGFVGVGTAFGLALAIFFLLGVVPFLMGVIIQRMFCFIKLPSYVSWIISVVAVSLFWLTQGKIPISVLELPVLSIFVSIVLYGIFIDALCVRTRILASIMPGSIIRTLQPRLFAAFKIDFSILSMDGC